MRKAAGLLFVSGVSSRRPDNTYEGVIQNADGSVTLDIAAQTRAVFNNINVVLQSAGASLENLVDVTVFLVDMKDYVEMNKVYNKLFDAHNGPTRTTIAVHQLPNPHLLIEVKAVALAP